MWASYISWMLFHWIIVSIHVEKNHTTLNDLNVTITSTDFDQLVHLNCTVAVDCILAVDTVSLNSDWARSDWGTVGS